MKSENQLPPAQPALAAIFMALISVGIALSTLYVPSGPIKIAVLAAAAMLLAATGAFLASMLARPQPSIDR